jgi:hypothetical protein
MPQDWPVQKADFVVAEHAALSLTPCVQMYE